MVVKNRRKNLPCFSASSLEASTAFFFALSSLRALASAVENPDLLCLSLPLVDGLVGRFLEPEARVDRGILVSVDSRRLEDVNKNRKISSPTWALCPKKYLNSCRSGNPRDTIGIFTTSITAFFRCRRQLFNQSTPKKQWY